MIKKILINKCNSFDKNYINLLEQLRILNVLKDKKIIDDLTYKKSSVRLKNSYNSN